jgi:hypothetical protein
MKKIITTVALLIFVIFAFGQKMDIGSGAYVTQGPGSYITVDGDLSVNASGTFTVKSTASGTGSLILTGSSSGNVTFERYVDEASKAATWHFVSSPVSGQAINSTWMSSNSIDQATNNQYQFYRWDEDTDYWIYFGSTGNPEAFTDATFVEARGYSLTRSSAGIVSFTGTVRTSDLNYATTYTSGKGEGWNLVGNPFTSSIGVTSSASTTGKFLTTNSSLLDASYSALFIWDEATSYNGTRNDYKIISNSSITGYTQISQHYIQPGQAFMVKVVSGGGNLAFNENMQAHTSDIYYKNTKEVWPSVELIVENNELFNATAIGFNDNMTKGLDPSYDVGKLKGNPDIALYSKLIEDNGVDFAIQALPLLKEDIVKVKIGLDISQAGDYKFRLVKSENFDKSTSVKLEDKETGLLVDFDEIEEYFFNADQAGEIRERFVLHFNNATGIEETLNKTQNIQFYVSNNILYLIDEEIGNGTLSLFNMLGQSVMTKNITGNTSEISLDLPSGYYIVNIQTNQSSVNGKVFVK